MLHYNFSLIIQTLITIENYKHSKKMSSVKRNYSIRETCYKIFIHTYTFFYIIIITLIYECTLEKNATYKYKF